MVLLFLINILYYIGPRPLDVFPKLIPYRLFMGVVIMIFVWWANVVGGPGQEFFPIHFYVIFLLVLAVYQVRCNLHFPS